MNKFIVPSAFVWSRIGPESGETLDLVLERKERQRLASGGVFVWGVGHSVRNGVQRLLEGEPRPRVLFTRIQGAGARIDRAPRGLLLWRGYHDEGEVRPLPPGAIVVSRAHTRLGIKIRQYALFCASNEPLRLRTIGSFNRGGVVNIESGHPVGASQVTAVVRHVGDGEGRQAEIVLEADLIAPYAAQLADPISIDESDLQRAYAASDWLSAVTALVNRK